MVVVLVAFEASVTLFCIVRCSCDGLTGLKFVDTCRVIEFCASWSGVKDPCCTTLSGEDFAGNVDVFNGDDESLPLEIDFPLEWDEWPDDVFCRTCKDNVLFDLPFNLYSRVYEFEIYSHTFITLNAYQTITYIIICTCIYISVGKAIYVRVIFSFFFTILNFLEIWESPRTHRSLRI